MQCFNLNKDIELQCEIEDLLLISIDDQIETIDDKDGVKVGGKILISGNAKTNEGSKEFSDSIDLDLFLTYDEIEQRSSLNVGVNDFNYKIDNNKLNINIVLKVEGLKEIETTFLSQEDCELLDEEEIKEELEEIYEEDRTIIGEEIIVEDNLTYKDEKIEESCISIKENNDSKLSLLKSVFSNKRIKEEVSWKLHCVKGETSYEEIAAKYNVSLNKLVSINKNEELEDGKLIFLPLE